MDPEEDDDNLYTQLRWSATWQNKPERTVAAMVNPLAIVRLVGEGIAAAL